MLKQLTLFAIIASLVSPLLAADPAAEASAKVLAPVLDNDVVLVTKIDVSKIDLKAFFGLDDVVTGSMGRSIRRLIPLTIEWQKQFLAAGGTDVYAVYSMTSDRSGPGYLVVPLAANAKRAEITKLVSEHIGRGDDVGTKEIGEILVVGNPHVAQKFDAQFKPVARPEFTLAFETTSGSAVQSVVALSADQRRVIAELAPELPKDLEVSFPQLVTGVDWLALGFDFSDKPRGKFVARASTDTNATLLNGLLLKVVQQAAGSQSLPKSVQAAAKSGKLNPQIAGQQVVISLGDENLGVKAVTTLLTDVASEWFDERQRIQVRDNCKEIALALHNYSDSHDGRFPPAATDGKDGKPRLSWRVQILPWIDGSGLYAKFRQNEPWDSPHNIALLKEIPDVYTTLGQDRAAGLTQFQMPTNKGMVGGDPSGIRIKDVTDGTSMTIFFLHVDEATAVPWTKPQDLEIDLKNPWKGLISADRDSLWSSFIDGSARRLDKKADAENLLKYLTIGGGELISN